MTAEIKKYLGSLNPLAILDQWLKEALKIPRLKEPWAMSLSTARKGRPSSRWVLLKSLSAGKLIFYTNYLSAKGEDIKSQPWSALNFYWPQLGRQIRIEGLTRKISPARSSAYWRARGRDRQISQWISQQSRAAPSRKELEALRKAAQKKFLGKKIPRPPHWGGYALQIQKIEFWMAGKHRLHDRFLFEKEGKGWKAQRLFP